MFDVSFSELILIGVIALIVIGPERLPTVARTVGHLLGRAQRYVNEVKSDIQHEMESNDLGNLKSQFEDAAKSIKSSAEEVSHSIQNPIAEAQEALKNAGESVNASLNAANKAAIADNTAASTPAIANNTAAPSATSGNASASTGSTPTQGAAAPGSANTSAGAKSVPEATTASQVDPLTLPLPGFEHPANETEKAGKPSTGAST
jgi:sec-independent protein translocase protein TatB